MLTVTKRGSQRSLLALNSLSAQLLLWIALPAALAVLVISLVEIRSHEQAMQRLVQARAHSLVQATAALLTTQVEDTQAVLLALAGALPANLTGKPEPQAALFSGGLTVFARNGQPLPQAAPAAWATHAQVKALVADVGQGKADTPVTLYDAERQTWLLVQAVAAPGPTPAVVLVGAQVIDREALRTLIRSFLQSNTAELHIESASGQILAELARPHEGFALDTAAKIVSAETVLPATGWRVVLREHWSELVPPELRYENVVFTGVAMAILFALLAVYVGLRSIISPLRRLNWAASQIGGGNFATIDEPVGGVAEIEELRLALAGMAGKIRQYQQELQNYIGAITAGQEEERKRLARELHDDTVQALIALKQQVELAGKELEREPPQATARLHALQPLLTETIASLRRQIHDLRPLYLEDLGFIPALEMLRQQASQRHHLLTNLVVRGEAGQRLTPTAELTLFRIAQEAIQNVVSHAQARSLDIELTFSEIGVRLRVTDDGAGFAAPVQPHQLAQVGHYGLLGMQERAQLQGGKFQIESVIGTGTAVTVWLPMTAAQNTPAGV